MRVFHPVLLASPCVSALDNVGTRFACRLDMEDMMTNPVADFRLRTAMSHEMRAERLRERETCLANNLAALSYKRAATFYDLIGFQATADMCRSRALLAKAGR